MKRYIGVDVRHFAVSGKSVTEIIFLHHMSATLIAKTPLTPAIVAVNICC